MNTQLQNKLKFILPFLLSMTPHLLDASPQEEIVIAIIDTGADTSHPFIKDHLWSAPKNKIFGKGSAHDIHGWNFSSDSEDISDEHGHGTHIAGIILQNAGSAKIKLMVLKYYDPSQSGEKNLLNTVKAIQYATKMKADIINYSGGGDSRSYLEEAAIQEAERQGIIFIAAAGNEGRNNDEFGYYPAGYKLSNIISVAAMDENENLLDVSNYGKSSVDIVAPGKQIFSSLPQKKFGYMTGTSQATAWVTGLVAQIMYSEGKKVAPPEVKKQLMALAIKDRQLMTKIKSESKITSLPKDFSWFNYQANLSSMVTN
ncbi:serine protease [Bdellovibrio bacteriovorus W]|nr:serine protease [Bdellovibrio bacteriovorus W]